MRRLTVLLFVICSTSLCAQPVEQRIKVIVAPDHADWTYKTGEKVKFNVSVLQDGNPVKNVVIRYETGLEKMDPQKKEAATLKAGTMTIEGGSLSSSGFLRCTVFAEVNGKEYRGFATAGFDPLAIKPTVEYPGDFLTFWNAAKADLAKIPLDSKMTLLPERCTEKVNVYHLSIQNYRLGSHVYGILCVPKADGKFPAMLKVPGAGIRPYNGDVATAETGIITLEIGIHGIPVNLDPQVYLDLAAGSLSQYNNANLDDRDQYYYKRVYMGCVRANDFLASMPQFDGMNLAVTGGSQGGALSIVTAALDQRVKYLAAYYPALSDVTGYLHGRAGGWPHLFIKNKMEFNDKKDKIETCGYYDVVNFARQLKIPGIYSWGYNDETCPPTSMYAAYNVITAPKELMLVPETGHWIYPEQRDKFSEWLSGKLKGW
jgi:cephalosporin-C deacetylase